MPQERRLSVAVAFSDSEALLFAFHDELLLTGREDGRSVPVLSSIEDLGLDVVFQQEVGFLRGKRCFATEVAGGDAAPDGYVFRDLRGLWGGDEDFFRVAGKAKQIVAWNKTHQYCGRCGWRTEQGDEEFVKKCPNCGMTYYPRLSPAAIMLVHRGDELLLARSPHFPPGMYSALAGFVEPGESIEETVRREVAEEVGVEVGEVRYFGSQPWPFPNSLMIGFTAEWSGGELRIGEPEELEDARWFRTDNLPPMPPKVSIARAMIDAFLSGKVLAKSH